MKRKNNSENCWIDSKATEACPKKYLRILKLENFEYRALEWQCQTGGSLFTIERKLSKWTGVSKQIMMKRTDPWTFSKTQWLSNTFGCGLFAADLGIVKGVCSLNVRRCQTLTSMFAFETSDRLLELVERTQNTNSSLERIWISHRKVESKGVLEFNSFRLNHPE